MAGKSAAVSSGAVAGKVKKHLADACLLDHGFVKDEKSPVAWSCAGWGRKEASIFQ